MVARTLGGQRSELTLRECVGSHMRASTRRSSTAYDIARQYQNDARSATPAIYDESVLRYNGTIIGVFDRTLADFRGQVDSVANYQCQVESFWLANACWRFPG
jgi:hypothetical protein